MATCDGSQTLRIAQAWVNLQLKPSARAPIRPGIHILRGIHAETLGILGHDVVVFAVELTAVAFDWLSAAKVAGAMASPKEHEGQIWVRASGVA